MRKPPLPAAPPEIARRQDARNAIVYRINRLATSFSRSSAKLYKKTFDLGLPSVRVIYTLADHGELTSKDLVQITAMDKALVSRVLAELTHRGLISNDDDRDRIRRRPWRLTPNGVELSRTMQPVRARRQTKLMEDFSDAEATQLNLLLDRLFQSSEKLRLEEEKSGKTRSGRRT